MDNSNISIIDNKFEIIRYEGLGYVKNICNYDKNIFNLKISYYPNEFEGGVCKTNYSFEVIKKDNFVNSRIEFIEDYSDYKYIIFYDYNPNDNNVIKIRNNSEKLDINKKLNKILNKNKTMCVIL